THGHLDHAVRMLKQVVGLKPNDSLSAKLIQQLQSMGSQKPLGGPDTTPSAPAGGPASSPSVPELVPPSTGTSARTAVPEPVETNTKMPEGATISGTWTAATGQDTQVSLAIQPEGNFRWQVSHQGQSREFSGTSTFGAGILTLVPDKMPPIVGRVTW